MMCRMLASSPIAITFAFASMSSSTAFLHPLFHHQPSTLPFLRPHPLYSFVADGSDYSTSDSDYEDEPEPSSGETGPGYRPLAVDAPVIEEEPVPLSQNAANRFVAFVWDSKLQSQNKTKMELHEHRVSLTEEHVLYCRKANLYNETFNYNSIADVVWSYPLLSSDLRRYVGHAICIDSSSLEGAKELLEREPILRSLVASDDGEDVDVDDVPMYRWRHIKDHALRQDKGRFGVPTMIINLDRTDEKVRGLRERTSADHYRYLIESERVIQTGPLHRCTEDKNDSESVPVGSIVIMNAVDREHAVEFAERDPCALAGLYESIRVHRFNDLDVSGKFVLSNEFWGEDGGPCDQMRQAMEVWGYPVDDRQTAWING